MIARTYSAALQGMDSELIQIEAAKQTLPPKILITGLPGDVIKESRERIRVCLNQLGFDIPSAQLVVHLSPASAKKQGSQLDLAIAMSLLSAEGCIAARPLEGFGFLGELSLEGKVKPVSGILSLAEILTKQSQIEFILIPQENAEECRLLGSTKIKPIQHIAECIEFLEKKREIPNLSPYSVPYDRTSRNDGPFPTLDNVIGQTLAKRALEISLAGNHHLILIGPPGVGKSLLAHCSQSLLPPLSASELIEVTKAFNASGISRPLSLVRPFRSPHHSISKSGLLGGGTGNIQPGEVTLASQGILFLDEFPQFQRDAIEGLREPLEEGQIHIHRVGVFHTLPAHFILIAAMNPCPCGYSLDLKVCKCPREKVLQYRRRISGPILDRFDLGVVFHSSSRGFETAKEIHLTTKKKIETAIHSRKKRGKIPPLTKTCQDWLENKKEKTNLSYRQITKLTKVSRTIADLEQSSEIEISHLDEAWSLRCPDLFSL